FKSFLLKFNSLSGKSFSLCIVLVLSFKKSYIPTPPTTKSPVDNGKATMATIANKDRIAVDGLINHSPNLLSSSLAFAFGLDFSHFLYSSSVAGVLAIYLSFDMTFPSLSYVICEPVLRPLTQSVVDFSFPFSKFFSCPCSRLFL
ncbi:hypothetical protein GUG22_09445, partial [Xanthomonas citri pv. citri]|nr:hypothetical protein [Xanthomonas citri pv. citri]